MEEWPFSQFLEGYNILLEHKERSQNNDVLSVQTTDFRYESETRMWMKKDLNRLKVIEMRIFREIESVTERDRIMNEKP